MKPRIHAKNSVRKWGGQPEDYQDIHDFLDSSKEHVADMRHRAILHNSFGCYLAERVFGLYFYNSDGREVSVRDVAEQHILEDLGHIPPLSRSIQALPMLPWFGGRVKKTSIKLVD